MWCNVYSRQIQGCDKTLTGLCSGCDPKSWAAAILDANFGKSAVARGLGGEGVLIENEWETLCNTFVRRRIWCDSSFSTPIHEPFVHCLLWGQKVQNEDTFHGKIKKNTTLLSFKAFKRGSNRSGFTPQGGPCGRPSLGTSNPRQCYFQTWRETQFQICW